MENVNSILSPFKNPTVEAVFTAYPKHVRAKLLLIRQLVLDVGKQLHKLGELQESLKWGEPAYRLGHGVGSSVRIGWKPKTAEQYALYFHCRTTLVDSFRELYAERFRYEGNRAIIIGLNDTIPQQALKQCIAMTFTYHLDKKRRSAAKYVS